MPPRRAKSAHPSIVPFQNFQTADGWIVVAAPKEKFWERLCEAIGRPELATDPRFADFGARDRESRGARCRILDEAFRARPSAEWLELLGAAGVPSSPVNDVLAPRPRRARGSWRTSTRRSAPCARSRRRSGSRTASRRSRRAPFRGEHDGEVDDLVGA